MAKGGERNLCFTKMEYRWLLFFSSLVYRVGKRASKVFWRLLKNRDRLMVNEQRNSNNKYFNRR